MIEAWLIELPIPLDRYWGLPRSPRDPPGTKEKGKNAIPWKLPKPLLAALQELERNAFCDVVVWSQWEPSAEIKYPSSQSFSLALVPRGGRTGPGSRTLGIFRCRREYSSISSAQESTSLLHWGEKDCLDAYKEIAREQEDTSRPVWVVYQSVIFDNSIKGRGNGYLSYRVMAIFVGSIQGYFVPDRCAHGSTSDDAERVWVALRRDFVSVGPVLLPFEPQLAPTKLKYPKAALVLVGCGQRKCEMEEEDPEVKAQNLYISDFFKKKKKWAETFGRRWGILSAAYGYLAPNDRIETYDLSMKELSRDERNKWAAAVAARILFHSRSVRQLVRPGDTIYILAGTLYRNPLSSILEREGGVSVVNPLEGLGIGQQKKWLKETMENQG